MNKTLVGLFIATAVVAGFAGGLAARYWTVTPVFAQNVMPVPVLNAKSFVLMNDAGERRGILTLSRDGSARLRLYDEQGKPRLEMGSFVNSNVREGDEFDVRILSPEGRLVWSAQGGNSPPLAK